MMFRRLIVALFVASMIPLLWFVADAQAQEVCRTWRNIAGSRTCVRWVPGSEKCILDTTGAPKNLNASARCEVEPVDDNGITGTLVCTPAGRGNSYKERDEDRRRQKCEDRGSKAHRHDDDDDDCLVITGYNLTEDDVNFPLFEQTRRNEVKCDRRGNCTTKLSVNISRDDGDAICNNLLNTNEFTTTHHHSPARSFRFVDFTATGDFLGTARICKNGTFVNGEGGGACTGSEEVTIVSQCSLEEGGSYTCNECVEDYEGGLDCGSEGPA